MRIAERIARLEKRERADPRMTTEEIDLQAAALELAVANGDLPMGMTVDRARDAWRALIAAPTPAWLQRIYARMEPQDLFL